MRVKFPPVFTFYQNFKKVCIFLFQWSVTFRRMMRRQCRSKSRASWNWGLSWQRLDKLQVSAASGLLSLLPEMLGQVSSFCWSKGTLGMHPHFIGGIIQFYCQLTEPKLCSRKLSGCSTQFFSWKSFCSAGEEKSCSWWDIVICDLFLVWIYTVFPYVQAAAVFSYFTGQLWCMESG